MTDKPANYIAALQQAIDEGRELTKQRAIMDRKLAQLRETVITLLRLLDEDQPVNVNDLFESSEIPEQAETSLTEAISDVLKARDSFMTASEINTALARIGFDKQYAAPLPTIATTLTRLEKTGDVVSNTVNGKAVYKWNTSSFKHSPLKYIGQRGFAHRFANPPRSLKFPSPEKKKD